MKKAVFAGTFDPFTLGHEDTVTKSLMLFDEVVIAVAENKRKRTMFSPEERAKMIEKVFANEPRVRVLLWEGAIADLLQKENTPFYVRGVRNSRDFEYETEDLYASLDLFPELVAVYLPADKERAYVSSSLVKNCIAFQKPYTKYVPEAVAAFLDGKRKG